MGKILIIAGIVLIAAGLLWHFLDLGRLPGDFRIRRGNVSFYFPLTTCILLSILLSLIVYFFRK